MVARMRLLRLLIDHYRSFEVLDFEAGPFTVLFGKNNVGKTNILEAIYGAFAPYDEKAIRGPRDQVPPQGAAIVRLEPGIELDDEVLELIENFVNELPDQHIAFVGSWFEELGLLTKDPALFVGAKKSFSDVKESDYYIPEGPWMKPILLDWEFKGIYGRVETSIANITAGRVASKGEVFGLGNPSPWFERSSSSVNEHTYSLRSELLEVVDQLSALATDLLPDFVDGSIFAVVNDPQTWETASFRPYDFMKQRYLTSSEERFVINTSPKIDLIYMPRGRTEDDEPISIEGAGSGAARWMAAALQTALRLMFDFPALLNLRDADGGAFSGYLLLVDEPEAHLHPSAAASIVRWCSRMVDYGFTVITASHHEEFLRASGDNVTLVHIVKSADGAETIARTVPSRTAARLLELGADIGMHPAAALSVHRGILSVEGLLDEAVLDEYAGLELDAAGVKIVPIHGTKNLEGLISSELATQLGIKIGIMTDATNPATMAERSRRNLSSEERKLVKLIELADQRGLPLPKVFGVPEDDLLFALPADAICEFLNGPFPGWKELREECRQALGKGPSDSVDWKSYALDHYGLPITTPAGVREVVRALDLRNVALPSIRKAIDEVVVWAKRSD